MATTPAERNKQDLNCRVPIATGGWEGVSMILKKGNTWGFALQKRTGGGRSTTNKGQDKQFVVEKGPRGPNVIKKGQTRATGVWSKGKGRGQRVPLL